MLREDLINTLNTHNPTVPEALSELILLIHYILTEIAEDEKEYEQMTDSVKEALIDANRTVH